MAARSRRRIIFVNRFYAPDHSATAQMLTGIAEGLAKGPLAVDGQPAPPLDEVVVLTSRLRYDDPTARLAATEIRHGVTVRRVWTTRFGRAARLGRAIDYLSFYVAVGIVLLTTTRRGDIVVAKTDPPLLSLACALPVRLRRARLVNWLQDVFPEVATELGERAVPRSLGNVLARWRDANCRAAAANVVLGERMREFFLARGLPERNFHVIPNWASSEQIVPLATAESTLRRRLAVGNAVLVAYCGNLGRAHDHESLAAAITQLKARDDIRFLIVGGGAGQVALRRSLAEAGVAGVEFLPYQPEEALSDTLAAADIHLLCLRRELEGLIVPSKLYGIYAAGRPALNWGDVDGEVARELKRSATGVTVPDRDPTALATAIERLAEDPEMRALQGARAREVLVSQYSLPRALVAWRAMLDGLATGR